MAVLVTAIHVFAAPKKQDVHTEGRHDDIT
jgi:hypothetical protein